MNFVVSGSTGYIGHYFCEAARIAGHNIVEEPYEASVGIHLEWKHLPDYESAIHYNNVWSCLETAMAWRKRGLKNILIAGTCYEIIPNPPHYARAKLALLEEMVKRKADFHSIKWVRLFNIYGGDRERSSRLVPKLLQAVYRAHIDLDRPEFRVINASRDFMHVKKVVARLLRIAEQPQSGIYHCCRGEAVPVEAFCRSFIPDESVGIVADLEMPDYEPEELSGNPNHFTPL